MKCVWGLEGGKWLDPENIPEIIETLKYIKEKTSITKVAMLEALGVASSKYYSWQKKYRSPDFTTERPKRKTVNRLLPKEIKEIKELYSRYSHLEPERMASMLGRNSGVFVSPASIRNVIKREKLDAKKIKFDIFQIKTKFVNPPEKGLSKILYASLYIETPNGVP